MISAILFHEHDPDGADRMDLPIIDENLSVGCRVWSTHLSMITILTFILPYAALVSQRNIRYHSVPNVRINIHTLTELV